MVTRKQTECVRERERKEREKINSDTPTLSNGKKEQYICVYIYIYIYTHTAKKSMIKYIMKLLIMWRLEESSGASYHLSVQRVKMETEREFNIFLWKSRPRDMGRILFVLIRHSNICSLFFFFFSFFDSFSPRWKRM